MTLLTAWDMASYGRCLVSNASGCALFIPFKEDIFVQFHKDFPKKGAGHQCVYSIGLSADLPNTGKRFCCC